MPKDVVLETKELTIQYTEDAPPVVNKLDFAAQEGEFILVAGPSGGGKSSFLYSINGVIPHLTKANIAGEILLRGESIKDVTPSIRARSLGSVLQNADDQVIFDRVDDEVAFPLENLCVPTEQMHDRIAAALQMMDLPRDANPNHLSGGEKQKLITATTLAMGQKILLFDEPLANLDYKGAILLLDTLRKLCKQAGYTVLFVEHRLDWVLEYADKILWIENGSHRFFDKKEDFIPFWDKQISNALSFLWQHTELSEDAEKVLQAEKLSWSVKKTELLHEIDFTLHRGERWILIGDNGSGKTSFIHLLAGLQKPTRGNVRCLYGKKQKYKKIGVIMQNPNYQLFMPTVRQEIAYQAVSTQRVEHLIQAFELQGLEDRHPHSLSEGQKRKVGVAAVLAMNPEVLLFDEPTVGQDYRSLGLIIRELHRMNEEQALTMLTITHDTRCAHFLGEHVLWIEDGKVVQKGDITLLEKYRDRNS